MAILNRGQFYFPDDKVRFKNNPAEVARDWMGLEGTVMRTNANGTVQVYVPSKADRYPDGVATLESQIELIVPEKEEKHG